jgi:hypothetical protein
MKKKTNRKNRLKDIEIPPASGRRDFLISKYLLLRGVPELREGEVCQAEKTHPVMPLACHPSQEGIFFCILAI